MKILFVSNTVKTYSLGYKNDFYPLLELGHEIVWAANFKDFIGDKNEVPAEMKQIDIQSYPFHRSNLRALKTLKAILKEDKYDAVICTTPIGGALARMAAKKMKVPKVIYSAHGLLFFKGAPLINRTVYKWQELLMSHWTDAIVTITDEDFESAKKFKLRGKNNKNVFLVHGAGVDTKISLSSTKEEKRAELGLAPDDFAICSAGFLNKNKNNLVVVKAIGAIGDPHIKYLICGEGDEKANLEKVASELGISDQIVFLGFRTDMQDVMNACDAFAMPSFREGVPRALLEAMNLGLPCIGSDTRGIRELIGAENDKCLCKPDDHLAYAEAIKTVKDDEEYVASLIERNKKEVLKYTSDKVREELLEIYKQIL